MRNFTALEVDDALIRSRSARLSRRAQETAAARRQSLIALDGTFLSRKPRAAGGSCEWAALGVYAADLTSQE